MTTMQARRMESRQRERRPAPRVAVRYQVEFTAVGEPQALHAQAVGTNTGGVRLRTPTPLEPGTAVRLLVRPSSMFRCMLPGGHVTRRLYPRALLDHEPGGRLQPLDPPRDHLGGSRTDTPSGDARPLSIPRRYGYLSCPAPSPGRHATLDKTYKSPRDVSSASMEDVARTLGRVIRGLSGRSNFIFHADFAYAGGRRGPLLMVGALRGQWREHVRRNASATGYADGECELVDEDGARVLLLSKARGRGIGAAAVSALNSRLMRGTGATARFVDALGASAAPAAGPAPSADAAPARDAAANAADPAAHLASLLAGFADFKAAPTMEKLSGLSAKVAAWQALDESTTAGVKGAGQVAAIDELLREKGRAYVASRQRKPAAG